MILFWLACISFVVFDRLMEYPSYIFLSLFQCMLWVLSTPLKSCQHITKLRQTPRLCLIKEKVASSNITSWTLSWKGAGHLYTWKGCIRDNITWCQVVSFSYITRIFSLFSMFGILNLYWWYLSQSFPTLLRAKIISQNLTARQGTYPVFRSSVVFIILSSGEN